MPAITVGSQGQESDVGWSRLATTSVKFKLKTNSSRKYTTEVLLTKLWNHTSNRNTASSKKHRTRIINLQMSFLIWRDHSTKMCPTYTVKSRARMPLTKKLHTSPQTLNSSWTSAFHSKVWTIRKTSRKVLCPERRIKASCKTSALCCGHRGKPPRTETKFKRRVIFKTHCVIQCSAAKLKSYKGRQPIYR